MTTPGTRLGRYEIRAPLGAGGMGEVFLAWDTDLDREVAVKILRDGTRGDRTKRFVQEAKAASGLHHPNVAHVYEIGSHEDLHFIAMELVQGETLRARLRRGPMSVDETLDIAMQIAAGLGAAHKAGIVHRDIKPENVMITSDGYAKVLDFGLAKLREGSSPDSPTILKTTPGVAMGTLGYMAPEQFTGDEITPATDVYALGQVLREMSGKEKPHPGTPPKLLAVIEKSVAKPPQDRYRDATELLEALREISRSAIPLQTAPPARSRRLAAVVASVMLAIVVVAAGWWMFTRSRQRNEAVRSIEAAERLVGDRKLAEAHQAVLFASSVIPDDPRIVDILAQTSGKATFESDPSGATLFLQRVNGPQERTRMGVTPLTLPRLLRADYLVTLEKSGYATVTRPVSFLPIYYAGETFLRPIDVKMKLAPAATVPPGMDLVEGGPYRLGGYARPSDRLVELQDFFIDRFETSNRDFEEFIRAGGYRQRELWKHPFVDGANRLSFDQAMLRFRDTTGLPGPRHWIGGVPPVGREKHPVTDVTWYEAAAFAEWKGKKLPTVYQWEKAARPPLASSIGQSFPWGFVGPGIDVTDRANFIGNGTMEVDSMPFGAGPSGAHHMAGNVSEWCRNALPPGYTARGGSWSDAIYSFGQTAALPPFFSSPTLGFRCVSGGEGDEGDFALNASDIVPSYTAVDDATFAEYARRYDYERTPLEARVVERLESNDWTREKITYVVAGKTVPAWLYIPKGFSPPLQVIHFAPAGDVTSGYRTLPKSIEASLAPLVRSGRAIFAVELEGFLGRPRPPGWVRPEPREEEYVDFNVERVTEMRRGLDYLETRPDLDRSRIALLGISAGGGTGVFVTALDDRYRSVMFMGTGIASREKDYAPAANRIHFIPRIRAPKLMLHGRYDEDTPLASEAEPMFRLLPEPKKLEIFEGIHVAPAGQLVPTVTQWFDETMGPVGP